MLIKRWKVAVAHPRFPFLFSFLRRNQQEDFQLATGPAFFPSSAPVFSHHSLADIEFPSLRAKPPVSLHLDKELRTVCREKISPSQSSLPRHPTCPHSKSIQQRRVSWSRYSHQPSIPPEQHPPTCHTMSMYAGHRGMGPVPPGNGGERLNELLNQIRSEFESQMRATESFEHQSKQSPIAVCQGAYL